MTKEVKGPGLNQQEVAKQDVVEQEATAPFDRESLTGLDAEAIQKLLNAKVQESKTYIESIDQEETLVRMEADIVEELNAYDKVLSDREYDLANECEFDGKKYTKRDIANKIIYFLNKIEVTWQYSLGLYEMVKFWKDTSKTSINYRAYDSTLRTLNQVKFKGFSECGDILAINEYLSKNHQSYTEDTSWYLFQSEVHSQIIARLQELHGEEPTPVNE